MGIFELIPSSIILEGDTILPEVWDMKQKKEYKQGKYTSIILDSIYMGPKCVQE